MGPSDDGSRVRVGNLYTDVCTGGKKKILQSDKKCSNLSECKYDVCWMKDALLRQRLGAVIKGTSTLRQPIDLGYIANPAWENKVVANRGIKHFQSWQSAVDQSEEEQRCDATSLPSKAPESRLKIQSEMNFILRRESLDICCWTRLKGHAARLLLSSESLGFGDRTVARWLDAGKHVYAQPCPLK